MAAGIVDQRAGIGVDVFEGDPGRCEVAERVGGHVDGIGVESLLGAFVGGDGLQRTRLAAHEQAERVQEPWVFQDAAQGRGLAMRFR